jgi:hypothetical protein
MKSEVYEALKIFEKRVQAAFPGASFRLTDPYGGNDIGVELILPVAHITREERMKIAELAAEIEEEFDVYIGTVVKTEA